MSRRIVRGIALSALLAGALGLFPSSAQAAPARPSGTPRAVAAASPSLFGALWSQLVRLVAGDMPANPGNGNGNAYGRDPMYGEGPGICPHGR